MISYLTDLSSLKFPIATIDRNQEVESNADYLFINGQALLKRHDLLKTFNINEPWLPTTYAYIYFLESLLENRKLINKKIIIDNKLNLYIPVKKIKVVYRVVKFIKKEGQFILTSDYPCLIKDIGNKTARYPKICEVHNKPYLIGWTNTKVEPYETYI